MAILKDIELPSGVICNYHKIGALHINWHERYARIDVYSFVSKEAREDGKMIAREYRMDVPTEEFPYIAEQNVISDSYTYIKSKPEFEGAVDDL